VSRWYPSAGSTCGPSARVPHDLSRFPPRTRADGSRSHLIASLGKIVGQEQLAQIFAMDAMGHAGRIGVQRRPGQRGPGGDDDDPSSRLAEAFDRSVHYLLSRATLGLSPQDAPPGERPCVPELELLARREPQVNEPVEGRMWPTFLRASPSLADAAGVYVDRAGVLPMPWVLANCLLSHKALTPGPIDRDQRIGMLPKL